jgi:hypothetical protein
MEHFVDLIKSLREYFNDFVGAIVPGAVLGAGLTVQWAGAIPSDAISRYWGEWSWLPALAAMFAAGHTLLALHSYFISLISRDRAQSKVRANRSFEDYESFFKERLALAGLKSGDFHLLRNYAMSASTAASEIGRRFMFLALFCYGTATACAALSVSTLMASYFGYGSWGATKVTSALLLAAAVLLLDKRGSVLS